MKIRFIFLMMLSVSPGIYPETSGQKILNPEINPPTLRFDNFQLDNGNAEPTTTCVFQDRKGFIWCGTEFGLYRFDGVKYRKFGIGRDDSTLLGYTVLSILEDSDGIMWAGTYKALNRIDIKTGIIRHFIPDSNNKLSPQNTIRLIHEDRRGLIWLLTDRDIFTFNRKDERFMKYQVDSLAWRSGHPAVVNETERFLEDRSGRIWIATDNGLYLFNNEKQRLDKIYPTGTLNLESRGSRILCVVQDSTGNILFGTEKEGLLSYSGQGNGLIEKIDFDGSGNRQSQYKTISAVFPEARDNLWIFSNSMLFRYNPITGERRSYLFSDNSISSRKWGKLLLIDKIFRGKDGRLWLINLGLGQLFQFDQKDESLNYFAVPRYVEFSFIEDITGNLWFASVAQNMFRLIIDSLPFMTITIPNSGFADICNKKRISEDNDGNLWLALSEGICKIRNPDMSPALKPEKIQMPAGMGEPVSICVDRKNLFWIGFKDGIIMSYNPVDKKFRKYVLPSVPPVEYSASTAVICEDETGNIWFATQLHGIYKLAPGGKQIRHILSFDELTNDKSGMFLFDFHVGSDGKLWISTDDGLFRYDPAVREATNYTGFNGVEGGFGSFNARIKRDNNQNLWVLNSFSGPNIYNIDNNQFSKPDGIEVSQLFGFADLLFDKYDRLWLAEYGKVTVIDRRTGKTRFFNLAEKAGEISSFVTRSGRVVYIVNNKLMVFPKDLPSNAIIPPVYITGFSVNGKAFNKLFPEAGQLTDLRRADLKFNENNLKIEFAALNYIHPELNKYRYFMEGVDIDTVLTVPGSPAEYKQLAPGRYKFWVTGSNNDDVWNPAGVALDIRIWPPWYKSSAAIFLYIVAISILIAVYIKLRIVSLQKEKVRLEGEVKARTAELEIKNRQLAETDRIKTHFFTDISHEIRTPLSLIIGPLETISAEITRNARLSEMVEIMKRNAQRLMQLVDQLLDISRLDAGKLIINLSNGDIVKSLRILVYEFLSLAEGKQIKYIVELPEKEFFTWYDKDKIEKIVSNLLLNAFKYTPGNGTINCHIAIDQCETDKMQHWLKVKVTDSGSGIQPENLERIFERFFRVEGRNESEGHGSGIGLSITRDLARLLHGDVSVTSTPGKGSEFFVSLPLGKDHLMSEEYVLTEADRKGALIPANISYPSKRNMGKWKETGDEMKKVLIIEDNEDLRSFIRENLSDCYQVLGAENGRIGINIAFTMMPDIIVTDIMMPDVDGISLCRDLKNDERTSHIPVIMLTARATIADKLEGLRSGADDYLVKPFQMEELKVRISNLLTQREKIKYHPAQVSETRNKTPLSVDEQFIARVIKIIDENISDFDFDVGALHEKIGMSRMHLSRKLKIITGLSPHILIRNIRLEKAAELLLTDTGNITEIANSVGISNASGFSKAFREYFGVSPKKYSKQ